MRRAEGERERELRKKRGKERENLRDKIHNKVFCDNFSR
jgi:hypothetical protein